MKFSFFNKVLHISIIAGVIATIVPAYANDQSDINARYERERKRKDTIVVSGSIQHEMHGQKALHKTIKKVPTLLVKERDKLCPELSQVVGCAVEALRTVAKPTCEFDDLDVRLRFVDTINKKTDEITNTSFIIGDCPTEKTGSSAPPLVVTIEDFKKLKIKPSPLKIIPDLSNENPGIIKLPVFIETSTASQIIPTVVVGQEVTIRAVPQFFDIQWSDNPLEDNKTDRASSEWVKNNEIVHHYNRVGEHPITLSTQWVGSWSTDGTTWTRISGTVTTETVTTVPIGEAKPVIVNEDYRPDQ
ncbi:hypothetical protein [Timonella sp. A28]|uniref:hypothetical protein n=1 Tax=Timonella sp. A28 TaxID=3442640 RepID=UPI003EB7143E